MTRKPSVQSLRKQINQLSASDRAQLYGLIAGDEAAADGYELVADACQADAAPDGATVVALIDANSTAQDARSALDVLTDDAREEFLNLLADELFPLLDPRLRGAFAEVLTIMKSAFVGTARVGGEQPIVFLGERSYRIGDSAEFMVSDREDDVLQAFLTKPVMTAEELMRQSGQEDAVKVLKHLHDRLATTHTGTDLAIRSRPGKGPGYRVIVRPAAN